VIRRPALPDAPRAAENGLLTSPAAARNLDPILEALLPALPEAGRLLEVASGTGEHLVALARRRPGLTCQGSEPDALRRAAVAARAEAQPNMPAPLELDACRPGWGAAQRPVDAVLVVNLLHLISQAELSVFLDEAVQALAAPGLLAIYGPFLRDGEATSPGDLAFDRHLRAQDPAIGLKDAGDLETVLGVMGLSVTRRTLPANNLLLLARRPA
jgi:hypothetical protein